LKFFTNVRVVKSSAFCLFYRPAFFIKSLAIVLELVELLFGLPANEQVASFLPPQAEHFCCIFSSSCDIL